MSLVLPISYKYLYFRSSRHISELQTAAGTFAPVSAPDTVDMALDKADRAGIAGKEADSMDGY